MRVTQNLIQLQFVASLDTLQSNLAQTHNQLSTNLSFTTPSQNPVAAGAVDGYNQALAQATQYDTNANGAQSALGTEDNALAQVQTALQSLRDLALQANSGGLNASARGAIATQATQIQATLVSLANTQNGNGEYIFGGYTTQIQPFSLNAAGATYAGDLGQRQVPIAAGQSVAIGDSGDAVFNQIPTGNGTFSAAAGASNTGTGVLGATTVANPNAPTGAPFKIAFTAANTYQVTDATNVVVAGGAYTAGQNIAFSGLNVTLAGIPKSGDSFGVTPAAGGVVNVAANAANTGTGNTTASSYTGSNYNIAFTSATTYQVQRVTGGVTLVTATGTYAAGQAITVGNEKVTLNGAPKNGDSFAVNPSTNANYTVAAGSGNTGAGYADPIGYSGGAYSVKFLTPSTYQVLDAGNNPVTSGVYTADQSISFAGVQLTLTGTPAAGDTFGVAPSTNQSVFTTVQNLITALQAGGGSAASNAQLNNSIAGALNNIDQALNQTSTVRASVGGRLNSITTQLSVSSSQQIQLKTSISGLQDLDYASALTKLTLQQTQLTASMQAYTLTQGLSMFKYL